MKKRPTVLWVLLFMILIIIVGLGIWANIEMQDCSAINTCTGGEGLMQGIILTFVSVPGAIVLFLIIKSSL